MTPNEKRAAEYRREKLSLHHQLLQHDQDYAFECAVMGAEKTFDKYSLGELTRRSFRVSFDEE